MIKVIICISLMLQLVAGERKEITITISDLRALERDLMVNGVNSQAVEVIYSAASCNLQRDRELNSRLDKLINPIEQTRASVNKILNELAMKSSNLNEPQATLELMVKHRLIHSHEAENGLNDLRDDQRQNVEHNVALDADAEYLAMGSLVEEVDPELCRTYSVVNTLIEQSKDRRNQIIQIAVDVYGYDGTMTVTSLANFYVTYTKRYYSEKIKVMGLAKILGDYSSIVSEIYFLSDALKTASKKCGIVTKSREKRNVMQSQIVSGKCIRDYTSKAADFEGIDFLKKVPFYKSIKSGVLSGLGGYCADKIPAWDGILEKGIYRAAISATFSSGVRACVKLAACVQGYAYQGTGCIKHSNPREISNVQGFEISVVSGRMHIEELPEELLTLQRVYCSIQGKTVKTTGCDKPIKTSERFLLYNIDSKWYFTDREVMVAHGQDISNLCFYDCTGNGTYSQCKGDETYTSIFGKWDTSCYCSYGHDNSDIYLQIGSAKVSVDAIMFSNWEVTIPIQEEESVSCIGCKVKCLGRQLSIERDVKFDIIHLCVHQSCIVIDEDKPDFHYIIPNRFLHVTEFTIMFYRSDGKGKSIKTISCLDSHICAALHCDVCTERFANPHCYKFINWLLLVFIATSLILIVPTACLVYKVSLFIIMILLIPAKFMVKLTMAIYRKCVKGSRAIATSTSTRINDFVEDEPVRRKRLPSFTLTVALLCIFIPLCRSCENVITIDNKIIDCMPSANGEVKCAINTVVEVPLSSIGEESCLNLNDQAGNLVHIIKIKTVSIRQKCSKSVLYYSCDPEFKLLNTFRCRGAGECDDDYCEKIPQSGPVPVPSVNDDRAGIFGCLRVTGFWGKGCFYASQACQFYKIELMNSAHRSFEVSKCHEWFWEIKINATISNKDGTREEELLLDTTLPIKSLIGTIQLISINSPSITDTDKCFIKRLNGNMKTAIIDCSDRNLPIIGKIGGIQCASPALAEQASKSCLVDANSFQIIPQDDNIAFMNRFVNLTEVWSMNLLPSNLSGTVITEEPNGQIYLHYTGMSSYSIRVRMENYKISYTIIKPKCEAHFRSLKGCSNCGTGAVLEAEIAIDSTSRTPVKVTCPSAKLPGIQLAISSNPITSFKMIFDQSEIDEQCSVDCSGNIVDMDIKGTLLSNIVINQNNETTILGRGSDFFSSLPWASFGFLRYFYIIVGVVLLLPVLYVLMKIIMLLFSSTCGKWCKRKRHSKYY